MGCAFSEFDDFKSAKIIILGKFLASLPKVQFLTIL